MECSSDNTTNDQPVMNNDDNTATADSDDNIVTPQHKLSDNNLEDILVNKMTDTLLPASSSFQERKVLFIEQARRFVECV